MDGMILSEDKPDILPQLTGTPESRPRMLWSVSERQAHMVANREKKKEIDARILSEIQHYDDERILPVDLETLQKYRDLAGNIPLNEEELQDQMQCNSYAKTHHVFVVHPGGARNLTIILIHTLRYIMFNFLTAEAMGRDWVLPDYISRFGEFVRSSGDPSAIEVLDRIQAYVDEQLKIVSALQQN